jgi:hypothetical protein
MKTMMEPIPWLLDANTPAITYQTLKDLRPRGTSALQIRKANRRIMRLGAVPAILSRQAAGGNWRIDRGFYGPKFYSTHWSMVLLAELGAGGSDRRFRRGAEYMLEATECGVRKGLEEKSFGWSCLYGNILRYAWRAHRGRDGRLDSLIKFCAQGILNGFCECAWNGGEACAWGVVRTLWGLAGIPAARRSREVKAAVRRGVRFLLADHRLENADYPAARRGKISRLWFSLNFPLFYQADILFTLRVVDELGALHHRGARAALDWLESQRKGNGRWKGSSPYRRRTWREMGEPGETDRWVSLQALRLLRHAGRSGR